MISVSLERHFGPRRRRNNENRVFVSKTAAEVTDETFDAAPSRRIIPGDDEEIHAEANNLSKLPYR